VTLTELFDHSLINRRTQPALQTDRAYTFGEIDAFACRMAHLLSRRGLKSGDRLCFYLHNCPEFIALYLAATRLGVIVVPMNILYRDRELRHIIGDAEAAAVIAREQDAAHVPAGATVWHLEALLKESAHQPETRLIHVNDGETPALIIYTSGTTGAPKGAVLTHNMLAANAASLATCWQIGAADRLLLTLPLFHVHGLCVGLHSWLISGCLLRLEERFDHQAIEQQMREFQPTLFFGVPTMYVRLLDISDAAALEIGRTMRLFVSGSAPLSTRIWEGFKEKFGHAILERYGMSETLINTSNPYAGERRPGSVGLPLPGVLVRAFGDDGLPVADGASAEICVRGPNVFREYWRNPRATAGAFRDGWFKTGDMGFRSPDGYVTLQGRQSDLIISGGFNIYPREIEDFLHEQPGVVEAAVAGMADDVRGEVPVAFIVAREGWDAVRVERACREQLASFKVPRQFVVVERFPKTSLGKVQKRQLVDLIG
jgi:malonyl-CoA/methylmalonyl-CoA synthetase